MAIALAWLGPCSKSSKKPIKLPALRRKKSDVRHAAGRYTRMHLYPYFVGIKFLQQIGAYCKYILTKYAVHGRLVLPEYLLGTRSRDPR
jgi:hypothetical protein